MTKQEIKNVVSGLPLEHFSDVTDTSAAPNGKILKKVAGVWTAADETGGGGATSLETGTAPTEVGTLLAETFPGVALSGTNWTGGLPTGATVNDKLIIASGLSDWTRFIKLSKLYLYEKADWVFDFKAVTKAAGDGWGLHQDTTTFLTLYSASIYLKVDLSNGSDSGRVSMGSTTASNEYGYAQALAFNAGDDLRLTIHRTPWKTVTILENITTPANSKAFGEFDLQQWGTQGYVRLTFLGGQQEFTSVNISSRMTKYNLTKGVVFMGDSITNGSGASTVDRRWTDILMRSQQHLFENVGVGSWTSSTMAFGSRTTEVLTPILPKYVVINYGYNDHAQIVSLATYNANLTTIANEAIALGCTVIFVSPFPNLTSNSASYATEMQSVATALGCKYIDIRTVTTVGVLANPDYIYDSVHPNDLGHDVIGNETEKQAPELYRDIFTDINNDDIVAHNIPVGFSNDDIATFDVYGKLRRASRKSVVGQFIRLQTSGLYQQQVGGFNISGSFITGTGSTWQQKSNDGLRIGFNNGVNDTLGCNIDINNSGSGGVGYPQAWINWNSSVANISIQAYSNKAGIGSPNIAGSYNTLINSISAVSGTRNVSIGNRLFGVTSGNDNFSAGEGALKGVTTLSGNIEISVDGSGPSTNRQNSISFGYPNYAFNNDPIQSGDISFCTGPTAPKFWFNGRATGFDVIMNCSGTAGNNIAGPTWYFRGGRGTGNAAEGDIVHQLSVPGVSGTALHSTYAEKFRIRPAGVLVTGEMEATTTIKTASPGAGNASWKLGTLITAAVTADTTRYLEVEVAGVVYKVIVSS